MSGEELYQYLHVSKRKMKYLLENGYIPCINTGKRTHRYIVSRADARSFRKRLQNDPTVKEEFRGRFCSEHSATPSFQVTEEFCKQLATHLRELWRDEPEALPAVRVAELVGMHRGRIYTLGEQGKLFCITVGDRRICGKESVIAYFSSREVLRKPNATEAFGEWVKEFRERVKHT